MHSYSSVSLGVYPGEKLCIRGICNARLHTTAFYGIRGHGC